MRFRSKFENELKLLNSVPFIKKRLLNHVYLRIWSSFEFDHFDWLSHWMKKNSKNSQFSSFLGGMRRSKFEKTSSIHQETANHVYLRIWSSWLTFTVSQGMKANIKISQFSISAKVRVCDSGQNLKMTKTS